MNIIISQKSSTPIYEQIYEQIASQILSEELAANFCLPSIRGIARELGVSIITVKKAWERLESEGFIYTRGGVGCFVLPHETKNLNDKMHELAIIRLKNELPYFKDLGVGLEDFIEMIKNLY